VKPRVLVAYFSHSGNTRALARQIQALTDGDLHEIVPVEAYPEDYDTVVEQAKREIRAGNRPALRSDIPDLSAYDLVFIGSPNWWNTVAPPVLTFASKASLSGRTLVPFITHEGSGVGKCAADLKRAATGAMVLDGQAFRGSQVDSAHRGLSAWLNTLPLALRAG